jgi:hypothetical protein
MADKNYDIFITYLPDSELYARILEGKLIDRGYRVFLDFLKPTEWTDDTERIAKVTPILVVVLPPQYLTEVDYSEAKKKIRVVEESKRHIVFVNPTIGINNNDSAYIPQNIIDLVCEHQIVNIAFERSEASSLTHEVDNLITHHISPFIVPLKKMVFISYSRKDTKVADKICAAFDRVGITYFIDRKGISGGIEFPSIIAQAIKECKIFLFLASNNAYQSSFASNEITYAFYKKKDMLPYIIDNSVLPDELDLVFSSINRRNIKEHPIEPTLIDDILNLLNKGSAPQSTEHPSTSPNKGPVISFLKSHRKISIMSMSILAILMVIIVAPHIFFNSKTSPVYNIPSLSKSTDASVIKGIHDIQGIDLGLPSRTLWADRNIGAMSADSYGNLYAWGETATMANYNEGQYKFKKPLGASIAKTSYDIAFVKSNNKWWIPSAEQFKELIMYCKWQWFNTNGFCGYKVTGKNGNSIKLPAAGWIRSTTVEYQSRFGYYWTADAETDIPVFAKELIFSIKEKKMGRGYMYYGRSIRPVKK